MSEEQFPNNYKDWKFCITKKCGIPLTEEFIERRISVFSNDASPETKKFVSIYGEEWVQVILSYFQQALEEQQSH